MKRDNKMKETQELKQYNDVVTKYPKIFDISNYELCPKTGWIIYKPSNELLKSLRGGFETPYGILELTNYNELKYIQNFICDALHTLRCQRDNKIREIAKDLYK